MASSAASSGWWRRRDAIPAKPPNYPLRRAADASSANYSTFSNSSSGGGLPPTAPAPSLGLSTLAARRRLLAAIERKIQEKEQSSNLTTEFRDPFSLLLLLCAAFRLIDAVRHFAEDQLDRALVALGEVLFLSAAAAGNVLLNLAQKRRHHAEMAERVRVAVQDMVRDHETKSKDAGTDQDNGAPIWLGGGPQATVLLPSNSYVACYRDSQWQRLPMNLLVNGDVVGLMGGDIAPGEVQLVDPGVAELTKQRQVFPRGDKLPSWTRKHTKDTARSTATFNPALLLELCGEMRIFEMLETPVVRDIEDALFRINRPQTPTQKLQAQARLLAVYVCTLYSVLVLVAIGLRVVLQHRSLDTTLNHVLLGPIGVWLCFASLNTPLVLFVAEAAATASILGSFEDILVPKDSKNQPQDTAAMPENSNTTPAPENESDKHGSKQTGGKKDPPMSRIDNAMASFLKAATLGTPTADIYDVEDREKLRFEKAQKQSAIMRSLQYFLVVLRFRVMRCDLAHVSDRRHLPVPFRCFRLLERLGSTTMLCCFDDDILCEQAPSVEEIFLLNDKQGSNPATVLDLHAERMCDTGLKFEDPKWKQHLPSLKPIGLAIMLNDDEDPAGHYHETMRYLVNETLCPPMDEFGVRDPYLRSCTQRLSAHIRMLPFPKYLLNLSREMGFAVPEDLSVFTRKQSIHIICPRLAHHEHTNDHHDQGQEDTRYRGNLKSHLYSTVVLDKRSHRHQLMSRGHPTVVLAHCSEYWDGKSICPLTSEKQRAILDMYNQWRVEDLDCIAFSYVPVPHKLNALFNRSGLANSGGFASDSPSDRVSHTSFVGNKLPPVYLVDDSAESEVNSPQSVSGRQSLPFSSSVSEDRGLGRDHRHSNVGGTPLSPLASPSVADESGLESGPVTGGVSTSKSLGTPATTPPSRRRANLTLSDLESSTGLHASEAGSAEKDSLLWHIQDDQIFLGMVATGVQPKRHTPDFIEDLDACGIRFVYFSPRNMRRSKLLAEKMGIETDWNCAISLRSLESDGPDPHRMTSNYSDWDVKARLPHGVEAIRRHLEEVDNVPLLVSLYTDSTPETISEMISIFQENHEVVMGVGSSLKESNAPLFAQSDLAVALQGGVHAIFDKTIPHGKELPVFSDEDIQFSHILNTLACSLRLKSSHLEAGADKRRAGSAPGEDENATSGGTASVAHLIELIRLGRRMLTNFHQMNAFIFVSQLYLATIILAAYVVPFPLVPQLSCASIFWVLWVLVPALSLSMLATASEKNIMKKTPRKNEEFDLQDDLPRLAGYFVARHVPSALVAIVVFECLLGFSLQASKTADPSSLVDERYGDFRWMDFMLDNTLVLMRPRPRVVDAAIDRAEGGMLLVIGISIVASSCGYLYRCESLFSASPFRNLLWVSVATGLLCVQVLLSALRAGFMGSDGLSLWFFVREGVPWYFWAATLGIWPLLVVAVDEAVKTHDKHTLVRYDKFLRMQFDTRLGMWSPK